jgi:hypothetical protein
MHDFSGVHPDPDADFSNDVDPDLDPDLNEFWPATR